MRKRDWKELHDNLQKEMQLHSSVQLSPNSEQTEREMEQRDIRYPCDNYSLIFLLLSLPFSQTRSHAISGGSHQLKWTDCVADNIPRILHPQSDRAGRSAEKNVDPNARSAS